jgi:hypothetical protein
MKKLAAVTCLTILAVAGSAHAATFSRDILNTGGTVSLFAPDATVTPDGKIHVVAQGTLVASNQNASAREIYYMLYNSNGTELIGPTIINTPGPSRKGRPQIAALSDNRVVVTVTGGNGQSLPVYYMVVDPTGDAQDGGPATPANILDTTQTNVGVSTGTGHHAMAVDSAGIAHVIKGDNNGNMHIAFNPATGAIVTPEHTIAGNMVRRDPGFAIDSQDNLHVVFQQDVGDGPAVYMMLDNAGAVLIDQTVLYDGGAAIGPHASHFSLMVDGSDNVHIVYGDKRNTIDAGNWDNSSAGTMFYVRLDPSADDQSGDAADLANIQIGDQVSLGNFWYGRAFRHGGKIHMFAGGHHGRGNIFYRSADGNSAGTPKIYTASLGGQSWSKHYPTQAGSKLIFAEEIFSPTLVGGTTQLVMTSFSQFGGGGGGGAPGLPLLLVFGLAGLARLRRSHG